MFNTAFHRVFTNEGRFQNDTKDRGNWTSGVVGMGKLKGTKFGISAMSYPELDIINLTLSEAKAIYKEEWWDKLCMNQFHPAVQYQLFDSAINHGMYITNRILQITVGAKADGIIGPQTIAAVKRKEVNDLLMGFLSERLMFMTNIRTWDYYGKGWARRIAHNLKLATKDN